MSSKSSQNPTPMYPEVEIADEFSQSDHPSPPYAAVESAEEVLIRVPSTIVHLIDKNQSVQLAFGDLEIVRLVQNNAVVAVLARIGEQIQWPLAKDEPAVKLDESHYFFTLHVPKLSNEDEIGSDSVLNYGLTIASKGQEAVLGDFDQILESYSSFTVERVEGSGGGEVARWWGEASEVAVGPGELEADVEKREAVEEKAAAYWTTLAPNVEEYGSAVARMIAAGSGQVIKGIIWCGDLTVDRLKWGNEFLKKRLGKRENAVVSPLCMQRIERVKRMTKMSEDLAVGILSGVIRVSGMVTGSIVNSKVGKKFFSLLPGEIVLATLDGFNKVCDAVEVAGRNVMSTSQIVTTELVSERYGEQAGKATEEGMGAAGHAIGTAWAVLKIRKALNPRSAIKPTTLVKAAAAAQSAKTKGV